MQPENCRKLVDTFSKSQNSNRIICIKFIINQMSQIKHHLHLSQSHTQNAMHSQQNAQNWAKLIKKQHQNHLKSKRK